MSRVQCHVCDREVTLRKGGKLAKHYRTTPRRELCLGSGQQHREPLADHWTRLDSIEPMP